MKLKIVFAILIGLIMISCNTLNLKKASPVLVSELDTFYLGDKLIHVEKILKSDFDNLRTNGSIFNGTKLDSLRAHYLMKDSSIVKEVGDTLFLAVANNKKVALTNIPLIAVSADNDTSIEDYYERYWYQGFNEDIEKYVVYVLLYETSHFLLIDKKTGDKSTFYNEPMISPNKEYFICGASNLRDEHDEDFNGLQLYKNASKIVLTASRQLKKWGPTEIKWLGNSSLLVKCDVLDSSQYNNVKEEYFKLYWE